MKDPTATAPFDTVARDYDTAFTDTPLGRRQRDIVRRYVGGLVRPGCRVLELNCGTGADAVWLAGLGAEVVATDISPEMIRVAREKALHAGCSGSISHYVMSIEEFTAGSVPVEGRFDLVFSNFDGLNCVADPGGMPQALRRLLRPGGDAVLVFMNPVCAVEILYLLLRGRWGSAFQRLRRDGLPVHIGGGYMLRTYFHSIRGMKKTFSGGFVLRRVEAVGLSSPPTFMRGVFEKMERLFRALYPLEDALSAMSPFNRVGDHVMMHFTLGGGREINRESQRAQR